MLLLPIKVILGATILIFSWVKLRSYIALKLIYELDILVAGLREG